MRRLCELLALFLLCDTVTSISSQRLDTSRSPASTTTTTTQSPTEEKKLSLTNETVLCSPPDDDTFGTIESGGDDEQAAKVMLHGMDWSELLLPAPSVIGQLGSLLLTASAKDLQLAKDDQLNASKSLLESMILIGGDAFYAFFDAQTGIDNIIRRRFNDVTVSEHIKIVVDMHINGQGNQTLIVRKDLNNIKEMAELHSNQMKTVVKAFKEVYPLIEKLTIASLEQQKFVAEGSAGSEEKLTQTVAQLQALGNYWNQTTNFFQSFAIMVESKWKTKLIDFIDSVENVTKIERNFTKSATNATKSAYDRMYKSAFHATIIDYRINHLAETFVAVSETFFLRMLADVRTLAGVDTDSAAFTNSQQRLDAYIRAAPQQIMRKLVEENDRFNKGIDDMRSRLDKNFNRLCKNKVTKKRGDRSRD